MLADPPSRKRRIEDVASALFHERGYAATSVRDIARALDVQGASLYAHVTSKEEVLWAIVDRAAARFEHAADAAEARAKHAGPADQLAALVRAHVAVITSDVESATVFVREWRSLSAERQGRVAARRDAYERRFRSVIEAGMSAGDFALTDPAVAAAFVLSALNGLSTWYRPHGRLSGERIADYFVDLSTRALAGST